MIVAIGIMMFMPTDKSSEQEKKEESSQSENKETKEEPIKPAVDNIYESEKEITTLVNIYDIQHFNIPYLKQDDSFGGLIQLTGVFSKEYDQKHILIIPQTQLVEKGPANITYEKFNNGKINTTYLTKQYGCALCKPIQPTDLKATGLVKKISYDL